MLTVGATGNILTLREIHLILTTHPKGHPVRKIALRDVKTLRHYAAECGRQALELYRTRRLRTSNPTRHATR